MYDFDRSRGGAVVTVHDEVTFLASDLATKRTEVISAGRTASGATIRDKDGFTLLLIDAARVRRERYELEGLTDVLTLLSLLRTGTPVTAVAYGSFAWLAELPVEEQEKFVWEYASALLRVKATGYEPVEQLMYEWQQTARVWSDPLSREELSVPVSEPLGTVVQ